MTARVVVVGGGISGLAAAWTLCNVPDPPDVTVVEATTRVGGKIATGELDGVRVELGADAFLATTPETHEVAVAAGLGPELVAPAVTAPTIFWDGRLHPLPADVVAGAPTRLAPLLRSELLSAKGKLRAALDLVLPREVDVDRESVGELIEHRFGREVVERLADPLLGGVYAGDVWRLGAAAATPALADAARRRRSVLLGLRAHRRSGDEPAFLTVRGGLEALVGRLAAPADVRTAWPVRLLEPDGEGWAVHGSGEPLHADAVVVAVPAFDAAALLREAAPDVSAALREIPYASVTVVHLLYPPGSADPSGSGVLVPSAAGRGIKAATWVSSKWPHVGGGRIVVRVSVGRFGDDRMADLDDDELCGAVHEDLRAVAGFTSPPLAVRVTRWPRALPQYLSDHPTRLARVEAGVAHLRRLVLVGAAYRGVGITACVRDAVAAATALAPQLRAG